jgi:imidazolonepropionase-like amidohydrolase
MTTSTATTILRGQTLAFKADPFEVGPDAAVDFNSDGAVAVAGGKILEVGPARDVIARHPGATLESYAGDLIMAGFVDCHVHYPPTASSSSNGWRSTPFRPKPSFTTARTPMPLRIVFSTSACATA